MIIYIYAALLQRACVVSSSDCNACTLNSLDFRIVALGAPYNTAL